MFFNSCQWDVHSKGSSMGTGCADACTLAFVQAPWTDSISRHRKEHTYACEPQCSVLKTDFLTSVTSHHCPTLRCNYTGFLSILQCLYSPLPQDFTQAAWNLVPSCPFLQLHLSPPNYFLCTLLSSAQISLLPGSRPWPLPLSNPSPFPVLRALRVSCLLPYTT